MYITLYYFYVVVNSKCNLFYQNVNKSVVTINNI
nr:MAG TPA: hypothetical protein [Caudoviricetes sp.]